MYIILWSEGNLEEVSPSPLSPRNRSTERGVAKGGMNVAHEVAEAVVETLEHVSVKHGDLVDEVKIGLKEELANGLVEGNGAWDSSGVDNGLLRGLAAGVESGASIHQQSSYTRGGHGESNLSTRSVRLT